MRKCIPSLLLIFSMHGASGGEAGRLSLIRDALLRSASLHETIDFTVKTNFPAEKNTDPHLGTTWVIDRLAMADGGEKLYYKIERQRPELDKAPNIEIVTIRDDVRTTYSPSSKFAEITHDIRPVARRPRYPVPHLTNVWNHFLYEVLGTPDLRLENGPVEEGGYRCDVLFGHLDGDPEAFAFRIFVAEELDFMPVRVEELSSRGRDYEPVSHTLLTGYRRRGDGFFYPEMTATTYYHPAYPAVGECSETRFAELRINEPFDDRLFELSMVEGTRVINSVDGVRYTIDQNGQPAFTDTLRDPGAELEEKYGAKAGQADSQAPAPPAITATPSAAGNGASPATPASPAPPRPSGNGWWLLAAGVAVCLAAAAAAARHFRRRIK